MTRIRPALILTLALLALPASAWAGKTLRPPTGLTATTGNAKVLLSWTASSSRGVVGYDVYRENANGTWPTSPLANTASTSYTDTGLTNGTTYTYRVTSVGSGGTQSAPSNTASATPNVPPPGPCGSASTPPASYDHVVWVLMENHSYNEIIGSSSAPYINQLASQCGLAGNYFAASHPSLPNYVALSSGSTQGITDDNPPSSHPLNVPSIFSLLPAGGSRSLDESMPSNCLKSDSGEYAVRHNPETYYTNLGTDCSNFDVPFGSSPDLSARFTFITPNLIDDMHDGTVAQGDAFLSSYVPQLLASSQYQAGHTAIFITWDEDDGTQNNQVPTLVIAPSVAPGTVSTQMFTHYSLLRSTEEMLGVSPLLGNAATASDLRSAFNL
jgi:hypothetical protein